MICLDFWGTVYRKMHPKVYLGDGFAGALGNRTGVQASRSIVQRGHGRSFGRCEAVALASPIPSASNCPNGNAAISSTARGPAWQRLVNAMAKVTYGAEVDGLVRALQAPRPIT